MPKLKGTKVEMDEIYEVITKAEEACDAGSTGLPFMTYEQGVAEMARWMLGETEDKPLSED